MRVRSAKRDQAGKISGAMDASEAVCRVAAPLGGGLLLEHASVEGPMAVGVMLALAGAGALYELAPPTHKAALLAPRGGRAAEATAKKRD